MSEIKDFVEISKYAGERFDLVQAAGGNSSVKLDTGEMLIKASGFLLSDVNENAGYSRVFTKQVAAIVKNQDIISTGNKRERESLTGQLLKEATIDKQNRPSIETLLHSLLLKYTLHTHAVVVNMIVVRDNCKDILSAIFKDDSVAFVQYETPGIELAIALDNELQKFDAIPNIIILQNHGLIVTSDKKEEIETYTEYVLQKIEQYLTIDMAQYKLTNKVSRLYDSVTPSGDISFLSGDGFLNGLLETNPELFTDTPFCPDTFVYCSVKAVQIDSLSDKKSLEDYKEIHHELPKLVIYDGKLFFRASTLKKAREMEEVYKFHIMVLSQNQNQGLNFLPAQELAYLSNWEAEKYRQKL